MRLVSTQRLTSRDVSYEFMNRQMVWHAFTVRAKTQLRMPCDLTNSTGISALPSTTHQHTSPQPTLKQVHLTNYPLIPSPITNTFGMWYRHPNRCYQRESIPQRKILVSSSRPMCHLLRRRVYQPQSNRLSQCSHVPRQPHLLGYLKLDISSGYYGGSGRRATTASTTYTIYHRLRTCILLRMHHKPHDSYGG